MSLDLMTFNGAFCRIDGKFVLSDEIRPSLNAVPSGAIGLDYDGTGAACINDYIGITTGYEEQLWTATLVDTGDGTSWVSLQTYSGKGNTNLKVNTSAQEVDALPRSADIKISSSGCADEITHINQAAYGGTCA
jgi:hypothetical protein